MSQEGDAPATEKKEKKSSPVMLIAVVAALMLIEGVVVYVLVGMTSASGASASELELVEGSDADAQLAEIPLLTERFQNRSTGRVWLWETEIVLKVQQKNTERVSATLERNKAEIREGIAKLIGSATDRQLAEPGRQTMDRRLTAYVNEIFGSDGEGNPRVSDVLLPTLHGHPADF
ncbi:MAG: hypothetical protein AAF235_10110 [Planctomycetota bacterium]